MTHQIDLLLRRTHLRRRFCVSSGPVTSGPGINNHLVGFGPAWCDPHGPSTQLLTHRSVRPRLLWNIEYSPCSAWKSLGWSSGV